MKRKDLRGERFGRLVVIEVTDQRRRKEILWLCRCDCGDEILTSRYMLTHPWVKSCGCLQVDNGRRQGRLALRHGEARDGRVSVEYRTWDSMLARCENPRHKCYKNYGARGIAVCERWHSFENFLADMGRRPPNPPGRRVWSLDRKENDGDYEPGNCRWATSSQQTSNQRHATRLITIGGVVRGLTEWLAHFGVNRGTFYSRVERGLSAEEALTSCRHQ